MAELVIERVESGWVCRECGRTLEALYIGAYRFDSWCPCEEGTEEEYEGKLLERVRNLYEKSDGA